MNGFNEISGVNQMNGMSRMSGMCGVGGLTARAPLWVARTASAIGALLGLYFGYDIGRQIAGEMLAWLMALNAGLFGALMGDAVAEHLGGVITRARARLR